MAEDIKARIVFDTSGLNGLLGGGPTGGGGKGSSEGGGGGAFLTKGIGGALTKLALPLAALKHIWKGISKIVGILKDASPAFAAVTNMFKQSMKLFFKPFGDALAGLFRPLAIKLLKFMIAWNQFWAGKSWTDFKEETKSQAEEIYGEGGFTKQNIHDKIVNWWNETIEALKQKFTWANLYTWWDGFVVQLKEIFNLERFSEWWATTKEQFKEIFNWDTIKTKFDDWVTEIKELDWVKGITKALDELDWDWHPIQWLKDKFSEWTFEWDLITWLKEKFSEFWTWTFDIGKWIKEQISKLNPFSGKNTSSGGGSGRVDYIQASTGSRYGSSSGPDSPNDTVADDFISRPGMGIQRFSSDDTIIGTKGGMGGNVTINVNALDASSIDSATISKISSAVQEAMKKNFMSSSSQAWGI